MLDRQELLDFDPLVTLGFNDYEILTPEFINHAKDHITMAFKLRDYNDLENEELFKMWAKWTKVWYSSTTKSFKMSKNVFESKQSMDAKYILHYMPYLLFVRKCQGILTCTNDDCKIITPAPTGVSHV